MARRLHIVAAVTLLGGSATWAQRAEPQQEPAAAPGQLRDFDSQASSDDAAGGVVIGRPQAIGRPEAIGAPQAIGQPQSIGGAASQSRPSDPDAAQGPPPFQYDSIGGSAPAAFEPQTFDPDVELTPRADAAQEPLEEGADPRVQEIAPSYGEGLTDPELTAPTLAAEVEADALEGTPLTDEEVRALEAVQGPAQSADSGAPIGGSGTPVDGASPQTEPGLILGPTDPATGAMLGQPPAAPTNGQGTVAPGTGGSGAADQEAQAPPLQDTLESLDETSARSEALQTEQLLVLEELAAQDAAAREEEAAYAESVTQSQGDAARALNLVDAANRAVMRGETDVTTQVEQAKRSVVDAAEQARARGDLAREDQLGRALLWLDAARSSGVNRDSVAAMRQLEQARLALNGIVPSDPIPTYE